MMAAGHSVKQAAEILLGALRAPGEAAGYGAADWDLLLRMARRTRLLGRLAVIMDELALTEQLPDRVAAQLTAARVVVSQRQQTARWEVNRILHAPGTSGVPVVLLKGCAYIMADLPPARGRLLSDVDILVPAESLDSVEQALLAQGWKSVKLEEYDQRYYRTWMHELPPLSHPERGMEVDIHHTISPLTSRLHPDPQKLFQDSVPLGDGRLRVLQPVDMVLHSAVHLFYDGEFINGLRDLVDLADLFAHFGGRTEFWDELLERARSQGLQRPLFYALRYAERFLAAAIPAKVRERQNADKPAGGVLWLMDRLVEWVMLPDHPDHPRRRTAVAAWLLYVRSHWLRMPPGMLFTHLLRKQLMRWKRGKPGNAAPLQGN